ncbi:MAG: tRNA uridine-5-carboxymethylaminomethyl(34) synthesis enzyme MnmG [Bacteroidales bacterium]|nr:tRNA uridine-5-carboxymethylaminomethyl(34) synthesis enzyme MnmG [Bacteroidales bacterium]
MTFSYDVIVVGAGHAGCEAAHAAARLGASTCLITMDMNKIGQMSCNPAVGGIAKGQIVREIDALGGKMGEVTDACSIQFRMLNRSKGPAMWSPRSQADRGKFIWAWRKVLENTPNLSIWQDTVKELIFVSRGTIGGVVTRMGVRFEAKAVVITAGTFLNGLMHIGRTMIPGGRVGEEASYGLTEQLVEAGITMGRMKTGTPVRLDGRTIDFSLAERQDGENDFHHFSYLPFTDEQKEARLQQMPCWTIQTNEKVHEVLRRGLPDSPLYNGQIHSIGPRYCPSIETKIVTFADKDHHLLFLEPEGTDTQEYYLNGFSSSLPIDIQLEALHHIPALAHAQAYRPGYAIEYDYFDPTQLLHTLESKVVANLFMAGQVNGTTGYEEAAGQGLVAGLNAALRALDRGSFTLSRDEAYIGVLIDDLVTKGVDEPYRMFTSRAEYRILLRQDDADMRLTEKGYKLGLATEERWRLFCEKRDCVERILSFCNEFHVKLSFNDVLSKLGSTPLKEGCKLVALINRPELTMLQLSEYVPELKSLFETLPADRREEIIEAAEVRIKYAGYIEREKMVADKIARLENIRLRPDFDYNSLQQLTIEARQKLSRIRPETVGQASRVPGVSPADVNILLVLLGR